MERKTCPNCGAAIEAERAGGLCPACLLKEGLAADGTTAGRRLRCHACQSALGEDARFCARCGAPVPVEPAAQGDPLRAALEAKLQAQYRIVRLLGRGGMGAVYLARDMTLDREVAIKVVKTDSHAREIQDRLRREARTAARLSHPNIVPLHAFGDVEGMPYFVMGYVRGESLATRLRRDGKLPEEDARRVLADVAEALDHAHRQGVVHRDVKPDNVLLDDESGRALLTDFGVAKALGGSETLTAVGSVVGTPSYMSPEQAAGRAEIDGRSDIYSLGVMAYAMLTGRLPFEGKTAADVLTKHLTQEPPPLRSLAPTLSDATLQAVERCLAKDPARRWPDARSLKLALGVSEEPQLPDTVRMVDGQGILFAVLTTIGMLALAGAPGQPWPPGALAFAIIYAYAVFRTRGEGLSIGETQRVIWREPSWWPFWYPRGLRRRGSVWDRLPAGVRLSRAWPLVICGCAFLLSVGLQLLYAVWGWRRFPPAFHLGQFAIDVLGFGGLLALWPVLMSRARSALERQGLDPADARRVAFTVPPSRASFWARPHIAAVLAPVPRVETARRPDSPHDQLQSILRNADGLSGTSRVLGAQAAVAARQLLVSIEQADRDLAELARSLDAGEAERLEAKIEALGEGSGPIRQLLEKQLELVRELQGRIAEGRDERSRSVEMLKTLALHLTTLRARAAVAPGEVPSLSERVRALCDEIDGQTLALAAARASAGQEASNTSTHARTPRRDL
ncbi:MAG TPA: serine/threonine-protein kinase [Vicinamibacteria bacterium]|nr:serine/threonine-protein kinase [Vicinamibacteria bacterium]